MSVSALDDERAGLLAQLSAAKEAVEGVRGARGQADADDEHDPEGSTLAQQWSHAHGLVVALERRLADNDAARRRLEQGTYGVCTRCGRTVGRERLDARPSAALCIACAARSDAG